ncbi:MAG: hypothetical protein RL213_1976 [Bacteroidota bacterium]|jgi:hypothetical protein
MNRQTLHQQLHNRLENLVERHLEMMQQDQSIPQQEMNDLLREMRIAYELGLSLHHHNALRSIQDLESMVANRFVGAESFAEADAPKPAPTEKNPAALQQLEEMSAEASKLAEEHRRAATVSNPEFKQRFEAPATVAGRFRENKTLAETIVGNSSSSRIAESIGHQPIRDLRTAIGINERFLFTQFLFGNNAEQFSRTLDHLNNLGSWTDAKSYLDAEVIPVHGWDVSMGTVRHFLELVERRFSA